jgi:hypothetical protein
MAAGDPIPGDGTDQAPVKMESAASTVLMLEETLRRAEENINVLNKKIDDKKAERTKDMYEALDTTKKILTEFENVLVSYIATNLSLSTS